VHLVSQSDSGAASYVDLAITYTPPGAKPRLQVSQLSGPRQKELKQFMKMAQKGFRGVVVHVPQSPPDNLEGEAFMITKQAPSGEILRTWDVRRLDRWLKP